MRCLKQHSHGRVAATLFSLGFACMGDLYAGAALGNTNAALQAAELQHSVSPAEPNLNLATGWWPDLKNIWTPIGWKDHVFRFNVLFDGTILVVPQRHPDLLPGYPGVQLAFVPVTDDMDPGRQLGGLAPGADDNRVVQAWNDCAAPVLRSEWAAHGFVFRQEVFAHIPGGQEVKSGVEPIFAWVRLSITDSCPGLPLASRAGFAVRINAPFVRTSMSVGRNIRYLPERSKYPAQLTLQAACKNSGCRLLEGDRRVRLGVSPGQKCDLELKTERPSEKDSVLILLLPAAKENHVDLLIPLAPIDPGEFDRELAVGYEQALEEANHYWSQLPAAAATFRVTEDPINRVIRRNLQMTQIIAEKDPSTGSYSLLSGSWTYGEGLWATPGSIALNFLDIMGYHAAVERYLDIFKRFQGTVLPPGPSYTLHPGYLSVPKTLTTIDWLTDHGALLWAISEHALLTGDEAFTRGWLPAIVKACDFIKDARRISGHGGVEGILPPAVGGDFKTVVQAVWSDSWNYKGLSTAVRLLTRLGHPRAGEFAAEAREYKASVRQAMVGKMQSMPAWTDAQGQVHRQVPSAISGQAAWETRSVGHLDAGALVLVFSGLMDAGDDLMKSALLWFREGPPVRFYRSDADWDQLPSLHHEMASGEPCYSWNVFHSWQLGDRTRFLEGMYSLFAGAYSRQTYTVCETRGGITGATHWLPSVCLARLAVIDDQLADGELHLLRLVPLAWLQTQASSTFQKMPTRFGPVSLEVKLAGAGDELDVSFRPTYRVMPERVVLHVPPVRGLKGIVLNHKRLAWDGKRKSLPLEVSSGSVSSIVRFPARRASLVQSDPSRMENEP